MLQFFRCYSWNITGEKGSILHKGCDPINVAAQNPPTWKHFWGRELWFLHRQPKSLALSGLAWPDVVDRKNEGKILFTKRQDFCCSLSVIINE